MYDLNEVGFSCILVLLHTQCIIPYPQSFSNSHNPINYHRLKAPVFLRILWCLRNSNRLVIRKCAADQLFQEPLFGSHRFLSFWVTSFMCREVFHMALKLCCCSRGLYFLFLCLFQLFREIIAN